jgi:transcriptional regulator with XRE-family HTH domain
MPTGLRFQGFGERIRHRMRDVGIRSQAELAKRLGEGTANVSRWISGNTLPNSMKKLEQLSQVLDVSVAWLLLGDRGLADMSERGDGATGVRNVHTLNRARRGRDSRR